MHRIAYFTDVASGGLIHMTLVEAGKALYAVHGGLSQREKLSVVSVKINKTKRTRVKLEFDVVFRLDIRNQDCWRGW